MPELGRAAGHQHAGWNSPTWTSVLRERKVPRADAGRRHHRKARDRDHRYRRAHRRRIPSSSRSRRFSDAPKSARIAASAPCSIVQNSRSHPGVEVAPFTFIVGFTHRIWRASWVRSRGFAAGNRVGQHARIGNFVELKNTHMVQAPRPIIWLTWATPRSATIPTSAPAPSPATTMAQQTQNAHRQGRFCGQQFHAGGPPRNRRR